ncbi:MAG TPA: hypothetical protein VGE92_12765 [Steroidobacteraceae bacterium]
MHTARVLTLCSVAAVSACHGDSPPPAAKPHFTLPAAAPKGPSAEELTRGMVLAASLGKSQLPVDLKFDLRQRPIVGQALDVDIALMPQIDASPADIQVTGGYGLSVAPGTDQIDLPAVQAGQAYRQSFKVTPSMDGVLMLGLSVSLKHDDVTESRVFSIPLIVER